MMTFIVVAALLTMSPGPDTMLVLRNVLRGGRRDGFATTLGICSGLAVHATLAAAGLSVILLHSARAFQGVKAVGAAYLVWLGIQSWRGALRARTVDPGFDGETRASRAFTAPYLEGFFTNTLNPKVAVFYLAFLPQFIAPGDPVVLKAFGLAGIHAAMGLVWLSAVAVAVDRAQQLVRRPGVRRGLDAVCGTALVGLGAKLALERR